MKSIINWGKSREKDLACILPMLPEDIDLFVAPFLGGGDVFLNAKAQRFAVSDRNETLISLWRQATVGQVRLVENLCAMDAGWRILEEEALPLMAPLYQVADSYLKGVVTDYQILVDGVGRVLNGGDWERVLPIYWANAEDLQMELRHTLVVAIEFILKDKHYRTQSAICKRLFTAIREGYFEYLQYLFNTFQNRPQLRASLLLYLMHFAKDGLFVTDPEKKYLVCMDYAGSAMNSVPFTSRLEVLLSKAFLERMTQTTLVKREYLALLKYASAREDFIFADTTLPAQESAFSAKGQLQLANYLLQKTSARWMVIMGMDDPVVKKYREHALNFLPYKDELIIWNY